MRILLVEDHHVLRETTMHLLRLENYNVTGADSVEEVLELPLTEKWDVAILDVNLPGESGLQLAQRLRERQPAIVIMMVTAKSALSDKLLGYEYGADSYFTKPVDYQELLAAIQAVERRLRTSYTHVSILVTYTLNMSARVLVHPRGASCRLTASEAEILYRMVLADNQFLATWQLRAALGSLDDEANKTHEVKLSRLRKKLMQLGAPEHCLIAVRSEGYQLKLPINIS